jgi:hypothetical protein
LKYKKKFPPPRRGRVRVGGAKATRSEVLYPLGKILWHLKCKAENDFQQRLMHRLRKLTPKNIFFLIES